MSHDHENIIYLDDAGTIDGLFYKRVKRSPDTPAYISYSSENASWQEITWREMATEVSRWRSALAKEGLHPGDRVGLSLRNCQEWVMFDQAALSLGLVVVPLYPDDRPDNIDFIVRDAGIKLLLVQNEGRWERLAPALADEAILHRVVVLATDHTNWDDERVAAASSWLPENGEPLSVRHGDPDALATIIYTSGTTGRPKGVMLSHRNILSVAHAGLIMVSVYPSDRFLSFLPMAHALERTAGYYLPMMAGSTVAFARSVPQLADDMIAIKPTCLIAVPRIFERIYGKVQQQLQAGSPYRRMLFNLTISVGWHRFEREQQRRAWHPRLLLWPLLQRLVGEKFKARLGGSLRVVVSGGAALPPSIGRVFIGLGLRLLQGYGLTECSPVISVNLPHTNRPDSVGVPLHGVEVKIGEHDELLARGPGVMLGYWNHHAATAETIDSDGWLHTADQARIEDGHIYITGRIKDIIVLSNGEKVPPGDMEHAILLDPLFEQVMIIGEGRSHLAALVVLNADLWPGLAQDKGLDPMSPASLKNKMLLKEALGRISRQLHDFPGYAKVRRVHLTLEPWTTENDLLTPTLKVKRTKVLAHYADAIEALYAK